MKVLIIEDEGDIRRYLRATLTAQNYDVVEAATAKEGLQRLTLDRPDVVILDLGLPDQDGQDFIRSVREWSQVPIVVLSAREQEADKIEALDGGADDYLTKPFAPGELLARIKVALRHAARGTATPETVDRNGLKIDLAARRVWLDGEDVHLTPIEYKLLTTLTQHSGKVLTHAQLLKAVWGRHSTEQNHYLRIHTQHLREKLKDDPLSPRFILTEPGIGYRFAD
ncbi:Fis family transcriptional regulator [Asticcacaulis sp. AC460]|uniref:response regulator n=1 Tax=Asticcacaulis sp. AC460 TaxID=1282360 RepID=UPI0003C3D7D7|nr:response regulator [Asticcacaulis sp. AC460]ESQ92202.1 Fis family transcriptional regulator [Asticcacaulis sp. AC460]